LIHFYKRAEASVWSYLGPLEAPAEEL